MRKNRLPRYIRRDWVEDEYLPRQSLILAEGHSAKLSAARANRGLPGIIPVRPIPDRQIDRNKLVHTLARVQHPHKPLAPGHNSRLNSDPFEVRRMALYIKRGLVSYDDVAAGVRG